MGCQDKVILDSHLTFSVCTHDVATGLLTDADFVPTYRVYEDEIAAAILTGSMTKIDDANTTGFYSKKIACTVANGFESNKSYIIYIESTVDSVVGSICYGFLVCEAASDIWNYSVREL